MSAMTWGLLRTAVLLVALAICNTQGFAKVDTLDLGPRPASGKDAVNGQQDRSNRIIHAFACDDEVSFLLKTAKAANEFNTAGDWPTSHLMAKAAFLTGRYLPDPSASMANRLRTCLAKEASLDYKGWEIVISTAKFPHYDDSKTNFDGAREWAQVMQAADAEKAAKLVSAVSNFYEARFGNVCIRAVMEGDGPAMVIRLSPECLMRQVKVVITSSELGAWKIVNEQRIPKWPGTSTGSMPCISAFPWRPLKGIEGDWDMNVIEYTRLAHLVYDAKTVRSDDVGADASVTLDKLNYWLLTLRGGPARELYDLFWSCGNPANSFGSADDYVNDNDVYNKDARETVSGKNDSEPSFWEKLWRFLRFLAIAAAVAFTLGALLGLLAGIGALAGGVAAATIAVGVVLVIAVSVPLGTGGIEETENHLFMQNSSKYLKNKLMMAELRQSGDRKGFDKVADENEDVREWLLKRMHRVVKDDFVEYNAKPYSRLSHQAILNLLDFSCEVSWNWDIAAWPPRSGDRACDAKDQSIQTAAASVYDLSAAKLSLGSSEGRRLIPFRRLAEANMQFRDEPRNFHDMANNADHLIAALQAWTGSTQHGPEGRASANSIPEMMWYATSSYLPHEMILDLAVDKSSPIEQAYTHGGYEAYTSGPRWLLTAGGDWTQAAQGFRINILPFGIFGSDLFNIYLLSPPNDEGVGVPTTLMVRGIQQPPRDTYKSFLRFEGNVEDLGLDDNKPLKSFSNNRCVSGNFACGLRLEIPDTIKKPCLRSANNPDAPVGLKFISSTDCDEYKQPGAGNDFFVAVFEGICNGCDYPNWGFLEVVEASSFNGSLQLYQDLLIAANKSHIEDWTKSDGTDKLTFYSISRKRSYKFKPSDEDFDRDCRACGTVVEGDDAKFNIKNPRWPGKMISIDYSDDMNPKRTGEGGLNLENP